MASDTCSRCSVFPDFGDDAVKYTSKKYTWERPFGSVRHQWSLIGRHGGLHFHATVTNDYGTSCGLEVHYRTPPDYMKDDAPSQSPCWLLSGPCWHDGTSLYASEELWPQIKGYVEYGEHDKIFDVLEHEADSRFADFRVRKCEEVEP